MLEVGIRGISGGLRMNMDDSRIIARFRRLTTGLMAGDELYWTWVELEQRGLKKTSE
jgi:hypothetical protein